tara:strand:- start:343 stop:510 length:168 start_codon:yes stop_codon:yes gene_type:complete
MKQNGNKNVQRAKSLSMQMSGKWRPRTDLQYAYFQRLRMIVRNKCVVIFGILSDF